MKRMRSSPLAAFVLGVLLAGACESGDDGDDSDPRNFCLRVADCFVDCGVSDTSIGCRNDCRADNPSPCGEDDVCELRYDESLDWALQVWEGCVSSGSTKACDEAEETCAALADP